MREAIFYLRWLNLWGKMRGDCDIYCKWPGLDVQVYDQPGDGMEKISVLIVDDESDVGEILSLRLERRGMQAHYASSGPAALEFLAEHKVDVVLLDVKMPGMDGLEVLTRIAGKYPGVAVIMLSGHADPDSAMDGIARGAFCYELKPVDIDTICNKIEDAVRQKALELEATA